MKIANNSYKPRLIDKKISKYLRVFKALQIVGPKWCGKTWTSIHHGNSIIRLTDITYRNIALSSPYSILNEEIPEVIDEWQLVPMVWDAVRNECDNRVTQGNFILTGSTTLLEKEQKKYISHTGTGRIIKLKMYPMSNYELGNSLDYISLKDMYDQKSVGKIIDFMSLKDISSLIINGGWPQNLTLPKDEQIDGLLAKEYLNSIINNDINERNDEYGFNFNKEKMKVIIKSLARNESSYASDSTILKDTFEFINENDRLMSKNTLLKYLDILDKLYLVDNVKPFSLNYRSSARLAKSYKRRLIDPSISAAALDLTYEKLIKDFNTFGLLFESLVMRDLNIYMSYYNGSVYSFRDNVSGDEVDAIVEFEDGEYGAIEIKLTQNGFDDALKSLKTFYNQVERKPKFMAVIIGCYVGLGRDEKTGIYIVPYNALGMHFNK